MQKRMSYQMRKEMQQLSKNNNNVCKNLQQISEKQSEGKISEKQSEGSLGEAIDKFTNKMLLCTINRTMMSAKIFNKVQRNNQKGHREKHPTNSPNKMPVYDKSYFKKGFDL